MFSILKSIIKQSSSIQLCLAILMLWLLVGCSKLVQVDPPVTSTSGANVYNSDATAAAVLTGIYTNMSSSTFSSGGITSLSLFPGLSADELTLFSPSNIVYNAYYVNGLTNSNTGASDFWNNIYPVIYVANSAVAGLTNNSALTPAVDSQLLGEAKFVRAFCYFYLVNLYSDVPLITNTNYLFNSTQARTPPADVWQQIISDLKDAQRLLSPNYLDPTVVNTTMERVRPTSWAAAALLARSYLYTQNWDSAKIQATAVIGNSTLYSLDTLNGVFLANNSEAIWQLQPVNFGQNSQEAILFVLPGSGPNTNNFPIYLSPFLESAFEPGDQRRITWVDSVSVGGTIYYFPYKYKINTFSAPVSEYETVLRLGEQYLIRAEAEAEQNDVADAANDLNIIRNRAGLNSTNASTQNDLLAAIQHERQVELFTEWGHRWLDLKRTGNVNTVLGPPGNVCAAKGGNWTSNWQWYPISLYELQHDPNLVQNKGY